MHLPYLHHQHMLQNLLNQLWRIERSLSEHLPDLPDPYCRQHVLDRRQERRKDRYSSKEQNLAPSDCPNSQ